MFRRVLLGLFIFVFLGVIVIWIAGGGPRKIYDTARTFISESSTSTEFALPWQPEGLFPVVDDTTIWDVDPSYGLEDESQMPNDDVMTFGDPSPFFRSIRISTYSSTPQSTDPNEEMIVIQAAAQNTAPISLEGWSLHSAVSGIRATLPGAAETLIAGTVNTTSAVTLDPSGTVIILTAPSPVGGSFRENTCVGYLAQFQSFTPSLLNQCPSPERELPITAQNIQQYGEECIDYMRTLSTCEFPQDHPSDISPACKAFTENTFSYNGCVNTHKDDLSFHKDSWRLFLESPTQLWGKHDAIRLLDADGQTVDVFVY